MRVRVRIHRWVKWWLYVGVIGGAVALANIFGRDLTFAQERFLWLMGGFHWVLGGIVCWAFDGVQVRQAKPPVEPAAAKAAAPVAEWHPASDFLLPGRRQSVLPAPVALSRHPRINLSDYLRASDERPRH